VLAAVLAAVAVATSACGANAGLATAHAPATPRTPAAAATSRAASAASSGAAPRTAAPARSAAKASSAQHTSALPLAGKIVGIDPGHNGRNGTDPAYLSQQVWNGRAWENCDTAGTQTDGGYPEALFNFRVASFLRGDLLRDGARVVLTRTSNDGLGPCVNTRASIINDGHANVAVDIHADGGPASGRGFAILEPVADGPNDAVVTASERLGSDIRQAFLAGTSMPVSSYDGIGGITQRDDLAGLNLTRVPKVLIECGNMRNATDAALLTSTAFQEQVARAFEAAIIRFLS
jgi:N-acetylmuramoyl-L-alanine amidase